DEITLPPPAYVTGFDPSIPSDVLGLEQVQSTPVALTALLVGLIALTVIHALAAAVNARRHEVAVLRTLGLTRRQVLGAVGVQAACIAAVGLLVGLPLGVAAGRVAWTELVEDLGGAVELVTPLLQLAGVGAAVLALALLVGLLPGVRAARAHPATILRTE
ncbi:MAG TPA: FtsX-like permease family protein, partial [Acidimicrobiales bacterium]|nr:FtsX-like permease family protein [Acidimicrobiales bacterium]